MPGPKKKPPTAKIYSEKYTTEGQRLTHDGSEVIMDNGRRFKRMVLPSVAERKAEQIKDELQLEEALAEIDSMRTKEKED